MIRVYILPNYKKLHKKRRKKNNRKTPKPLKYFKTKSKLEYKLI